MKTTKLLMVLFVMLFAGLIFKACQYDEFDDRLILSGEDGYISEEETLRESTLVVVKNQPVCINPDNPAYIENTQQETAMWGNPRSPFTKTVNIAYYNTLTHFVLKVKSTHGWADLVIDGNSAWVDGPVSENTWGEYSIELPANWAAGDVYSFSLKVAGNGPPTLFKVDYVLVGECENETLTDIEGNVYRTVQIGNQVWMAENLKTTKYRDGTFIVYPGENNTTWANNTTGAYAWYNNDIHWKDSYGALYNWHAVKTNKGLCPVGWHVPSDAEWTELVNYVDAQGYPNSNIVNGAGNALKSIRTDPDPHPRWNWHSTHKGLDIFGFSTLPGGLRWSGGSFDYLGSYGCWWSSTDASSTSAWSQLMAYGNGGVGRYYGNKADGFSIRCVRD